MSTAPAKGPPESSPARATWERYPDAEQRAQTLRAEAQEHASATCTEDSCKVCGFILYERAGGLDAETLDAHFSTEELGELENLTGQWADFDDDELHARVRAALARRKAAKPKREGLKKARRDGEEQPPKRSDHPLVRWARWERLGLPRELNAPANYTFAVLAAYANREGIAYPSAPTISRLTGTALTSVYAALRLLREGQIIRAEGQARRQGGKTGGPTKHAICEPPSPEEFERVFVPRLRELLQKRGKKPRRRTLAGRRRDSRGCLMKEATLLSQRRPG